MKTSINDKTLSYFPYSDLITASEILAYTKALFACGTDYIEINRNTAILLGDTDLSENYILRITDIADIGYCKSRKFAYVTVPLFLAPYITALVPEQQVIVEICADEYSAQAMLLYIKRFSFLSKISMIRLTGVFCDNGENMEKLIKWFRSEFFVPIDICPLNTMLTGVSDAIRAYCAGADMLTLSFGRGYYYSALEQFFVNVHIVKKRLMQGEIIKGICAASLIFSDIFGAIPTGLEQIIDTNSSITAAVFDVETGALFRPFRVVQNTRAEKESPITKKIQSIGLERELEDAIIDTLKKADIGLSALKTRTK